MSPARSTVCHPLRVVSEFICWLVSFAGLLPTIDIVVGKRTREHAFTVIFIDPDAFASKDHPIILQVFCTSAKPFEPVLITEVPPSIPMPIVNVVGFDLLGVLGILALI
jgi:hypothetical protein